MILAKKHISLIRVPDLQNNVSIVCDKSADSMSHVIVKERWVVPGLTTGHFHIGNAHFLTTRSEIDLSRLFKSDGGLHKADGAVPAWI